MKNKNIFRLSLLDGLLITILTILSLFLISFYFNAVTLDTHYPDWMVHAFRVKSLQDNGLASWTHQWSNGISLWRSYQFVPHAITIVVEKLFNVSITRAMILITIFFFVGWRLMIYILLRLLHFSPFTAFICSVLSYDIAQYWGGVADYSLMFGFFFFPILLFFWVKYYEGKIQYLFPYLTALSFYVHPILGYTTGALWITGIIFSERKIISLANMLQLVIFLATSSIFWFPILIKESYEYTSPVFANKYFLNLVLSGYKYFGLGFFTLAALLLSTIHVFYPIEKKFKWTKVLYIFVVSYFILIVLGLNVDLPTAIAQLQFTRGVSIVGIGIIFVFAGLIEKSRQIPSAAFKGVLLVFLCLVITEGMWFSSIYSPNPSSRDFPEAISAYKNKNPKINLTDGRIWTSTIGESGYYTSLDNRYPYSYMGHLESNQISPRLSPLILYQPYLDSVPLANINRLNDYFKIAGVKYIFFDQQSPFTQTILSSDKQIYKDLGQVRDNGAVYHAFQVPWQIRDAVAIAPKYEKNLGTFPFNLDLTAINDQVTLDSAVNRFVNVIDSPENTPLPIAYPSFDTIQIQVPKDLRTKVIYLDESFDAGWKGSFNKQQVTLKPTGPNFTKVILPVINESGYIFLEHQWPLSFYVSIYLISLIPVEILFFNIGRLLLFRNSRQANKSQWSPNYL